MTKPAHRPPPGPRGLPLVGSLPAIRANPLGYMADCERRYGKLVRLPLPWPLGALIQVSCPKLAEQVLVDDAEYFVKSSVQRQMVGLILGNGLFLAEGDAWKRQRRIVQPAFTRAKVDGYVATIVQCAEEMGESWAHGTERDVYADAADFTMHVAARTMFGARLGREVEQARAAMESVNSALQHHMHSLLPLPLTIPTPTAVRLRRATRALERITYQFIGDRRSGREHQEDLLSLLLEARDESGGHLSDRQLRDEAITAFVAGAETTAISLGWTLHLLAQHPEAAEAIRAEVVTVARGGRIEAAHLPSLQFTQWVVRESLRLYPPFWHIARETKEDITLAGRFIPRGTLVLIMTHLMHRNPEYFQEPGAFRPARWRDSEALPPHLRMAYAPFGGGKRKCIGQSLAIAELVATLATIVPHFHFQSTAMLPLPKPVASLRPAAGIRLEILRRAPERVASIFGSTEPRRVPAPRRRSDRSD